MDILCAGLVACDILAKPVRPDALSVDSSRLERLEPRPGGDALNVACSLARLGMDVALAGSVGRDVMGDFLRAELRAAGVHDGLTVDEHLSTSTCLVLVEECGERHFLYQGEANDAFSRADIPSALLRQTRHLHIGSAMALASLDGAELAALFREAKGLGVTTSLDVTSDNDGLWYEKIRDALRFTDYFLPSMSEASAISGQTELPGIEAFFRAAGVGVLTVKLGERGAFATDFTRRATVPAKAGVEVVDTTGAGDAFVAGFLSGVFAGLDLFDCVERGNRMGALAVTVLGAQPGSIPEDVFDK